jgi:hypothetical protein
MHLAHAMDDTGIVQDALGRRRLARINMGNNADVPNSI